MKESTGMVIETSSRKCLNLGKARKANPSYFDAFFCFSLLLPMILKILILSYDFRSNMQHYLLPEIFELCAVEDPRQHMLATADG